MLILILARFANGEYDQEMPQTQITDQLSAPQEIDTELRHIFSVFNYM